MRGRAWSTSTEITLQSCFSLHVHQFPLKALSLTGNSALLLLPGRVCVCLPSSLFESVHICVCVKDQSQIKESSANMKIITKILAA